MSHPVVTTGFLEFLTEALDFQATPLAGILGYGHKVQTWEHQAITDQEARELLQRDAIAAHRDVRLQTEGWDDLHRLEKQAAVAGEFGVEEEFLDSPADCCGGSCNP